MKDQLRAAGVVIPRDKLNAVIDAVRKAHPDLALADLVPHVQREAEKDRDCLIAILNAWDWSYDNLTRQCVSDHKKGLAGKANTDAKRPAARRGEESGNLSRDANVDLATSSPNDSGAQPGGGKPRSDTNPDLAPATAGASGAGDGKTIDDAKKAAAVSRASRAEAARAVNRASRSIWDDNIGLVVNLGDATKHHWMTLRLKGMVSSHVADRMLTEIDWPDDKTPTRQVVSEAQMKQILDSGYSLLGSIKDGRI